MELLWDCVGPGLPIRTATHEELEFAEDGSIHLRQEREQIGRFMQMVVDHKHKIGFRGTLLIEPKPQEPTKHQYDYDVATVYGFVGHDFVEVRSVVR